MNSPFGILLFSACHCAMRYTQQFHRIFQLVSCNNDGRSWVPKALPFYGHRRENALTVVRLFLVQMNADGQYFFCPQSIGNNGWFIVHEDTPE
jgi:hypothetical protein